MTEEEWLASGGPSLTHWLRASASARKLRLFASACCRRIASHFKDERSAALIEVSDRFADAQATEDELESAFDAAAEAQEAIHWEGGDAIDQASAEAVLGLHVGLELLQIYEGMYEVVGTLALAAAPQEDEHEISDAAWVDEAAILGTLLRDIFGNPFRPVAFDPAWRTDTAVAVARQMYESRNFGAMPILADALQDAGCEDEHILAHCRDTTAPHVRGCWVVDLVLGKS